MTPRWMRLLNGDIVVWASLSVLGVVIGSIMIWSYHGDVHRECSSQWQFPFLNCRLVKEQVISGGAIVGGPNPDNRQQSAPNVVPQAGPGVEPQPGQNDVPQARTTPGPQAEVNTGQQPGAGAEPSIGPYADPKAVTLPDRKPQTNADRRSPLSRFSAGGRRNAKDQPLDNREMLLKLLDAKSEMESRKKYITEMCKGYRESFIDDGTVSEKIKSICDEVVK